MTTDDTPARGPDPVMASGRKNGKKPRPSKPKGAAPLRIDPKKIDFPEAVSAERDPYWVGLLPREQSDGSTGLPFFRWSIGGVVFVWKQGPINNDTYTGPMGGVVRLTKAQRDQLLELISRRVVRRIGNSHRVLEIDSPRYVRDQRDVPIGAYLYIYPLDSDAVHNRPTTEPQPLIDW